MSKDFDLIVVGGGSGGLAGAFRAAEHSARVALLEPGALGGTCVNVGCVPKKAMWLAADVAHKLQLAQALGFPVAAAALEWPTFIAHRQRYIGNIHDSYRNRLDAAGIALLPTRAYFVGAHTVECDGGVRLSAPHILIATGGHAVRPAIPGAELGGDSDDFFDWIAAPARVAIVGGGYVSVELAGVLQALGSRVEVFVRGPRLLDGFEVELTDQLTEDYRQSGVHFHFGHRLAAVEAAGEGLRLRATSAAGVHAVGDVTTNLALTPVAIAAARRLMGRLFGGRDNNTLDQNDIPTVVFSHPPIATVGLTEARAREQHGDDVHVLRSGFRPMLNALADVPQRSLFKLVCVGSERRVVGIHLLGDSADEIMQGFAVALKRGITLDDLHDTIAIHPTSAEEVVLMR